MATDGVNITEDAEMAECEGDKVVTMMDVLQEQQEFEEDANAVLGASDDKNCTYAKGYIKRQAIYACLTCCPDVKSDPTKRAGVCLACSLMCHENHELVELYTKRNFRCDCGNPKFNSHPCQFTPSKPDLNDDNIYNQNFSGLYCICQRPYPDPEATVEDDMIQCIICEDWLHASHLDAVVPANDQYSEMICKGCMEKNEFLHDYSNFAVNIENVDVDILTVNGIKPQCNGDVSSENLTKSITENHSETATVISNGTDIEMSERSNGEDKELTDSSDKTKETTASDKVEHSIENSASDNVNLEATSQKEQETQLDETKQISDITKTADESEQNQNTNTDVKTSTSNDPVPETLEQKDEHTDKNLSEDKDDSNKTEDNVDTSKAKDSEDVNKSEDQLLDDIQTLTSDNPSNDVPKTSSEETTTLPAESETDKEKPEDSSETSTSMNATSVSETNIEVPDTSQLKDAEMATSDDKTDSVMDAIDELLKGPAETEKIDSKDNENQPSEKVDASNENIDNSEAPKTNEIDTSNSGNKSDNVPDKTDVEMTETKSQPEPSETKTPADSDTPKTADIDENSTTNKTEPNADNSCAESNLDKEVNGVVNNADAAEETINEHKRKLSIESAEETSPKKIKLNKCVRPKHVKKVYKGATFWPSNFRQKLCTCGECISMYKDLHVLFLTDPEDTVSAYESLGKENTDCVASQYEKGLQALSSLDRIQQINALTEYNKMRDKLLDFLKSFKDRKEIVKEEDIKAFFAGMKPRREPDGVYFCR